MLWSDFLPELITFATGCPNPTAESKTRQAAIEFFRRTRAWTEWLDPVTSIAGAVEYDFDVPTGADVTRVERATVAAKPIAVLSYRDATYDLARKDLSEQGLVSRDRKTFRLGQAVAAGQLIQVQAALIPSRASTGIPDDLFDRYVDEIAHGARARILSIPGTPFYNPDMAMLEDAAFASSMAKNSVDAWRGHTANTTHSRVTFF